MIKDSFDTIEQLRAQHPTGTQGDAYLVGGSLYVWDDDAQDWSEIGNLQGPEGEFHINDPLFTASDSDNGSVAIGYGSTLLFESSTLDIEVSDSPASVRIDAPPSHGHTVQFSSVIPGTVRAFGGARSTVVAVGIGSNEFVHVSDDPVTVPRAALSIKMTAAGTMTSLQYFVSVTAAALDASVSTIHARLYKANSFDATQFNYVDGTEASILIPYGTSEGSYFTRSVTLNEEIAAGTQLMVIFHNTSSAGGAGYVSAIMSATAIVQ